MIENGYTFNIIHVMKTYLVYSADWTVEIQAHDEFEAVLRATKNSFDTLGEEFCLGPSIVVQHVSSNHLKFFSPIAVLQDMGKNSLARSLSKYLNQK